MLTGTRAVALGAMMTLAGCTGPGGEDQVGFQPEACLLVGLPGEPPESREAFLLADEHVERFPALGLVFETSEHTVSIDCAEGAAMFEALRAEGADVIMLDQATGHNAYLTRSGATHHVTLETRA